MGSAFTESLCLPSGAAWISNSFLSAQLKLKAKLLEEYIEEGVTVCEMNPTVSRPDSSNC